MDDGPYILVAEDDAPIRQALSDALGAAGYRVFTAEDGREAMEQLITREVDLVLLDVNMPELNGFQLLKFISRECPGVSSIILTAHGEEADRVRGLQLGADDYVVKPFSMAELQARITAVLRRSAGRARVISAPLEYPGGKLDPATHLVEDESGRSIRLTEKEFELFRYLLMHPGRVIPQEELLLRVWGSPSHSLRTRTVAVTLTRLREKIGPRAAAHIENVRGLGYQWRES